MANTQDFATSAKKARGAEDNTVLLDGQTGKAVQTANTQTVFRCIVFL